MSDKTTSGTEKRKTSFRGWGGARGDWHGGRSTKKTAPSRTAEDWEALLRPFQKSDESNVVKEGRDDVSKLNISPTGKKFARMQSKEAFNTNGTGTDEKWKTSLKLRAELGGESPDAPMKSKDAVGKVGHAMKGVKETRAQQIVSRMLA